MRTPSFFIALFLLACHFLSLPVTLASPVASVEPLFQRQICQDPSGGCRDAKVPAVANAFQLSSSSQAAASTSAPTAESQSSAVVASTSSSAPASTSSSVPASTPSPAKESSSSKSNAGVALVSYRKLYLAAFAVSVATVLAF